MNKQEVQMKTLRCQREGGGEVKGNGVQILQYTDNVS